MPHSLSAKKRTRQNERRRQRNRAIKRRIRTTQRHFREALNAGDLNAAQAQFRMAERLLHRAAGNGPLHRNTAGRHIRRMQKHLDEAQEAAGPAT